MKVGDQVQVVRCDVCSKVVNKIGVVLGIVDTTVEIKFGRGRPELNRPKNFAMDDLAVLEKES